MKVLDSGKEAAPLDRYRVYDRRRAGARRPEDELDLWQSGWLFEIPSAASAAGTPAGPSS